MKIRPYFRWYDLWFGIFIDTKKKILYIGIPLVGLKFEFAGVKE